MSMTGCLIGGDLRHSFSEIVHRMIGTDYKLINLKEEETGDFLRSSSFDFINVTVPYKEKVMKYLDDIDEKVIRTGACNLIRKTNGKLIGYNTDYDGFALSTMRRKINFTGKKVLTLGTGGTAKMIRTFCFDRNALCCDLCSRFPEKKGSRQKGIVGYHDLKKDYQIIINATPVGTYPALTEIPLDLASFTSLEAVIDCVYNPFRTALILQAEQLKKTSFPELEIDNGLGMLIYQALRCYRDCPRETDYRRIYREIASRRNIVLIGMPGAGKTSVGRLLQEAFPFKTLIDTDFVIESRFGKIEKIFSEEGEEAFRKYESEVISEIALKSDTIIAVGGGAVTVKDNMIRLASTGILFFLDCPVRFPLIGERPLVKGEEDWKRLEKERRRLYLKYADEIIKAEDINIVKNEIKIRFVERMQ